MKRIKVIEDFEEAVRTHEMKGAYPLEEREMIEFHYQTYKQELINYITRLQRKGNKQ